MATSDKLNKQPGTHIFIAHGRSLVWRELKDFIHDTLKLQFDEFNRIPSAGQTTVERLSEMLDSACFALIVMTAEDLRDDGHTQPRMNVVHEAGLFQGRLGFKRAIILLEEGCHRFSNIDGLTYIPFPVGKIRAAFHDVREVLEREGITSAAMTPVLAPPSDPYTQEVTLRLSDEEQQLLLTAEADKAGSISISESTTSRKIFSNGKVLNELNAKSEATWIAALKRLVGLSLFEPYNYEEKMFILTAIGHTAAEQLRKDLAEEKATENTPSVEEKPTVKWGCYKFEGDEQLYCTACWETKKKKHRTTRLSSKERQCPVCKSKFGSG